MDDLVEYFTVLVRLVLSGDFCGTLFTGFSVLLYLSSLLVVLTVVCSGLVE